MAACRFITANAPFAADFVDPSESPDDSAEMRTKLDEVMTLNTTVK
jgi:hypothetical protein